jgi:hypothetical protein
MDRNAWSGSRPAGPCPPQKPLDDGRILATGEDTLRDASDLRAARADLFHADGESLLVLAGGVAGAETEALAQLAAAVSAMPGNARVLIVTRGCWAPGGMAGAVLESGAGAWGLVQAMRAERPDVVCRTVDVAPHADLLAPLLAEIADAGSETGPQGALRGTGTAWAGERRYAARLAAQPASAPAPAPAPPLRAASRNARGPCVGAAGGSGAARRRDRDRGRRRRAGVA